MLVLSTISVLGVYLSLHLRCSAWHSGDLVQTQNGRELRNPKYAVPFPSPGHFDDGALLRALETRVEKILRVENIKQEAKVHV